MPFIHTFSPKHCRSFWAISQKKTRWIMHHFLGKGATHQPSQLLAPWDLFVAYHGSECRGSLEPNFGGLVLTNCNPILLNPPSLIQCHSCKWSQCDPVSMLLSFPMLANFPTRACAFSFDLFVFFELVTEWRRGFHYTHATECNSIHVALLQLPELL